MEFIQESCHASESSRHAGLPAAFVIKDVEVAPPKDEILVKIVATGVCHTDAVMRDNRVVPMPAILGHEGAGIVASVGEAVAASG